MAKKDALERFWDMVELNFEAVQQDNPNSECRLDFLDEYVAIVVDGKIVATYRNPYNE